MKIAKFPTMFLSIVLGLSLIWATAYQHGSTTKQVSASLRIKDAAIHAAVKIEPETLNLRSGGRWITSYIELPTDYDPSNIDIASIRLNATIPAEVKSAAIGDHDKNGVLDLMVKFNRTTLISNILSFLETPTLSSMLALRLTGSVIDGTPFEGTDTIRIIARMPSYEIAMKQLPI